MTPGRFPYLSDEELVLFALVGDLQAFDELVRRFRGAVVAAAEAVTGSRSLAEDAAQDAFLAAFKALPQLERPESFPGWLHAIARHRARRLAARAGRQEPAAPSELDQALLAHSEELGRAPEAGLMEAETGAAVRAALAALPAEHRVTLGLYYFEEWPVARIAAFLSLPETTVKWRLHDGRRRLRHLLAPEPGPGARPVERTQRSRQHGTPHRQPGGTPHLPDAPRDGAPRPRSQPHRQPRARRTQLGTPVQ